MGMIATVGDTAHRVAEPETVAKKKSKPAAPKTLFAVKGSEEWFDWLKEYADEISVSAMSAIDIALRSQAKRDGFLKPMPKRTKKASE